MWNYKRNCFYAIAKVNALDEAITIELLDGSHCTAFADCQRSAMIKCEVYTEKSVVFALKLNSRVQITKSVAYVRYNNDGCVEIVDMRTTSADAVYYSLLERMILEAENNNGIFAELYRHIDNFVSL